MISTPEQSAFVEGARPLIRELCGDKIDRAALELLGKSPEDGRAELEQACRALAVEAARTQGMSDIEAIMLSDAVGREIIARHNELTTFMSRA